MESIDNRYKFLTVETTKKSILLEKNSKFISYIFNINSVEEANTIITDLKKEFPDANHVCWAYVLNDKNKTWRVSDDGEPTGTAGLPIYNQILSAKLKNVLIAVIRYFGGIKLGVPGLIKAYKNSAKSVIETALIVEKEPLIKMKIIFDYSQADKIISYSKQNNFEITEMQFEIECNIEVKLPISKKQTFINHLNKLNIKHFNI